MTYIASPPAGNLYLAALRFLSKKGRWVTPTETRWHTQSAMRCWARRVLVILARIFRTRIHGGKMRIACVFWSMCEACSPRTRLRIMHLDAIVITERPKLGPHFSAMREALAEALGIEASRINLKAKTNEGVGAVGRGEAIAAQAIATLES